MAFAFTVVHQGISDGRKKVNGTFATASGDVSGSLGPSTHGLNYVETYSLKLNAGGLGTTLPKITNSLGTLTISCDDTQGYSGTWEVTGL